MLDPLTAVSLAASIVQLAHFVRQTFSDAHEIYKSVDGGLVRNAELELVSRRLRELANELQTRMPEEVEELKKIPDQKPLPTKQELAAIDAWNRRVAIDNQLLELVSEAQSISSELRSQLDKLKSRGGQWASIRKAILSAWTQADLKKCEDRLEKIRCEIDTNLLASGRYVRSALVVISR
jgi:hypothetical protein